MEAVRAANLRLARQVEEGRRTTDALLPVVPVPDVVPTAATVRAEALKTVADLSRAGLVMVGISPARRGSVLEPTTDGQLAPGFAEIFGLSATQFESIQATLRDVGQEIAEVIAAHASVTRDKEDVLRIEVPPVPELAAQRTRVRMALLAALGEEGLATYEALRRGSIDSLFNRRGGNHEKTPMTATITRVPPGGGSRYASGIASGADGETYQYATVVGDPASLAGSMRNLGLLAKLVPEDFLKPAKP